MVLLVILSSRFLLPKSGALWSTKISFNPSFPPINSVIYDTVRRREKTRQKSVQSVTQTPILFSLINSSDQNIKKSQKFHESSWTLTNLFSSNKFHIIHKPTFSLFLVRIDLTTTNIHQQIFVSIPNTHITTVSINLKIQTRTQTTISKYEQNQVEDIESI